MSALESLHRAHVQRRKRLDGARPRVKIFRPGTPPRREERCCMDAIMGHAAPVPTAEPPMKRIMREVAAKHGVPVDYITGKARVAWILAARDEFVYRATAETNNSSIVIGRYCGGRNHTTILYSVWRYCAHNDVPHPRNATGTGVFLRKQMQGRYIR